MGGIRIRVVVAWALAIFMAMTFALQAGLPKLAGAGVEAFERFGYPGGFSYVIGLVEFGGAVLLLLPSYAAWGAGALAIVMLGAIYTHLSTGIGSSTMAALWLSVAGVIIALRARDARGVRGPRAPRS